MQISIGELHKLLGGELRLGSMPPRDGELTPVGRVVSDSRHVHVGDVFWGLRGRQIDGAHYAEEAYTRGANGVVTSGRWVAPWAGRWSLAVADAHASLARLAAWHRQRFNGSLIAVAGSIGKTTAQAMIHAVLSTRHVGCAATSPQEGCANTSISLLRLEPHNDFAVLRIDASASRDALAQHELLEPELAVFTQLGEAIDGGPDAENSFEAARELRDSLPSDTVVIANGDDPLLRKLFEGRRGRTVWFGRALTCGICATQIESRNGWLRFRASGHLLRTPVWGRHHLASALAAVAVGREFGLDWQEIAAGLASFHPVPARCEVVTAGDVTIIDDCCNELPSAMQAATALLGEMSVTGRRIVVCGDFQRPDELGAQERQRTGEAFVCRAGADIVVACGEHADEVAHAAQHAGLSAKRTFAYRTPEQAITALGAIAAAGDTVLVKGGQKSGLASIARALVALPINRAA